jgi:methyl-accepting chemotaxis protein
VRDIALEVRNSTDEQSVSARGINVAMDNISSDVKSIKKMLESQLTETERIANASTMMLEIAQANDSIAQEFTRALGDLMQTGREFEDEVQKFKTS